MINSKRFLDAQYYLAAERSNFLYIYFTLFFILLVLAFLSKIVLKRKEDFLAYKSFQSQVYFAYLFFGLLGLGATFFRFEKLSGFEPRIIVFSVIGLFLLTNIWLAIFYYKWTKKNIVAFHDKARKDKWLKKSRKS